MSSRRARASISAGALALAAAALVAGASAQSHAPAADTEGVALVVRPLAAAEPSAAKLNAKDCVRVTTSTPYAVPGYNHVVHLKNVCRPAADCVVTTNVNPDPITVRVEGNSELDVVTWRGSPASSFTPNVVCKMQE